MFERLDDLSFFVHSRDTRPSTSTGPTASHSPSHSLELASSFKAERECIVVRTAGRIRQTAGKESLAARDVSAVCARSSQQWQSPRRKPLGWQSHHPDKRVTKNADLRDETQTHVVRQPGGHASTSKTVHRDVKILREALKAGLEMGPLLCVFFVPGPQTTYPFLRTYTRKS